MITPDLTQCTVSELRDLYARRQASPVEAIDACLRRIKTLNPDLNAFVLVDPEGARAAAREAERRLAGNSHIPPLLGIPASVKDNIMTAGLRSSSGSRLFRDFVPSEDAGVVKALKRAGAIVIGKTNTSAFGWNATTLNMVYGPSRNPHDRSRASGGSSGGAAVSAAAGLTPINIGTDGGGSLRVPAAFTGTVGFKPSYGRVPDTPPHTHWIIQHYGPVARRVSDIALTLAAIAGPDARDPGSLPATAIAIEPIARPLRVLFTTQLGYVARVEAEIATRCRDAALSMRELGWTVMEEDLAWPDPAPFANVIAAAGLARRLRPFADRLDQVEDGIRDAVRRAETFGPHDFYDACLAWREWCAHSANLFDEIDLLITPTTACQPFAFDKTGPDTIDGYPVAPGAWTAFLRAFNLTGQPAISVPCGTTATGMPIGMQIVGPRHGDNLVLAAAAAFERLRPWKVAWSPDDMKSETGRTA